MASNVEQRQRLALLLVPDALKGDYWDYSIHRENLRGNNFKDKCYGISGQIRKDWPPESIPAEFRNRGGESWGYTLAESAEEISRSKWQREEAAIWVLEAIGTDAAIAILERMATGHPDAGPTIAAREVLARRLRK